MARQSDGHLLRPAAAATVLRCAVLHRQHAHDTFDLARRLQLLSPAAQCRGVSRVRATHAFSRDRQRAGRSGAVLAGLQLPLSGDAALSLREHAHAAGGARRGRRCLLQRRSRVGSGHDQVAAGARRAAQVVARRLAARRGFGAHLLSQRQSHCRSRLAGDSRAESALRVDQGRRSQAPVLLPCAQLVRRSGVRAVARGPAGLPALPSRDALRGATRGAVAARHRGARAGQVVAHASHLQEDAARAQFPRRPRRRMGRAASRVLQRPDAVEYRCKSQSTDW